MGIVLSNCDMLKVPGTKTFLKLVEQAKNEAKPRGVSKSQDRNTGDSDLALADKELLHKSWAFSANSPLE